VSSAEASAASLVLEGSDDVGAGFMSGVVVGGGAAQPSDLVLRSTADKLCRFPFPGVGHRVVEAGDVVFEDKDQASLGFSILPLGDADGDGPDDLMIHEWYGALWFLYSGGM
jgi:hypothetical protein